MPILTVLQPLIGIVALTLLAWLCSGKFRQFPVKVVIVSLLLQFLLAAICLNVPVIQQVLQVINGAVLGVEKATQVGTQLVFGYLGGADTPFEVTNPNNGFILAFRALPIVIVFSALFALLWHWRITPMIINGLAYGLKKALNLNSAVGLGAAASVFIGMVEAPMVIRQRLSTLTKHEFFILMTCGMATVAGTVMGLFAFIIAPVIDNALTQIIIASVVSVPAAIMIATLMQPETESPSETSSPEAKSSNSEPHPPKSPYLSSMHALTQGTQDGLSLFLNIIASLIVFVALANLVDALLSFITVNGQPIGLELILGTLFRPLVWCLGIPWSESATAGELLASKIILTELVAYIQLANLPTEALSDHSRLIMAYALCGFANVGSLGILLGGLLTICPERRADILKLAPKTLISGNLATCLTGLVVGIITSFSI